MKRYDKIIFIIILILGVFATFLYSDKEKIFPHNVHKENSVECAVCHTGVTKSTLAKDDNLPKDDGICSKECHEKGFLAKTKLFRTKPSYELKFNHQIHIDQDVKCEKCHKGINDKDYKPGTAYPPMKVCYECHDGKSAPKTCTLCHTGRVPFPHYTHKENGVECGSCHKNAAKSTRTKDNNLPNNTACMECHKKDVLDVTKLDLFPTEVKIIFNHQIHVDQDIKCETCHAGINKTGYNKGAAFPKMPVCFKCHNNKEAPKRCTLCHSEPLQFPHLVHIKNGLECDNCHKNIKTSLTTTGAKDIPGKNICNECHDPKDKYSDVVSFPYKQQYHFSHKVHVGDQSLECKECHKVLYEKEKFDPAELVPKMDYCFGCHDNSTATQYCMLCHLNPTKPKDHYYDWDNFHKKKANADLKECIACHLSKNFCLSCHKGIKKPEKTHNANFELTHKYEARSSLQNCRACHTERQCRNCHISSKISAGSAERYKYPHPTGWVDKTSPNFHKKFAKMNLASCTACHTKKDCWGCHNYSAGSVGPRPKR